MKLSISPSVWSAVSIGGWCGVAMVLRQQLGLCPHAYPFDYVLSTFEGINHFLAHDFRDFFPPDPIPVYENGRMVFKAPYTVFLHHDLREPEVVAAFKRRIDRFYATLKAGGPLLLVRASGVFFDESAQIPVLTALLQKRFPALDYRLLVISHYPGPALTGNLPEQVICCPAGSDQDWEQTYPRLIQKALSNW